MNGMLTTSCERDVVMRTRRSHVKRMITCEPGCGCVNLLASLNGVMCERGVVV